MDINGIVALVTGGASGLGAATVKRFVAAGGKAVIADLNEDKGNALSEELGDAVRFVKTDVTNEDQVQAAIDAAADLGTLRANVNCAGIGWAQRIVNREGKPHSLSAFQNTISVNLVGTFNVMRLAASAISQTDPVDGERGVIVNTASVAAFEGQIGQVAYSASKGGIVGMTLPVARDLAKAHIRVNTIAPGLFDTPLLAMLPEPARQALAKAIPNPARLGDPDEFAALVLTIVANPYLNGETIRLDGALRMQPK